jgi:hypothetical protein
LKLLSILWTRARYFSSVGSLVMHSFSIYPDTTFESMQSTHVWTPIALSLQRLSRMASYSAMLSVHLSISLVN